MNTTIQFDIAVKVRFNALESTVLGHLTGDPKPSFSERRFQIDELIALNRRLADAIDPNNSEVTIPDRFLEEDLHDNIPAEDLFDKMETAIANAERAHNISETFRYDDSADL